MRVFPLFLAIIAPVSLWIASTASLTYESRSSYNTLIRNNATAANENIREFFDTYHDMSLNFVSYFSASQNVSKQEMQTFFEKMDLKKTWQLQRDSIQYYGWYSLKNVQKESFFIPHAKRNISAYFLSTASKDKNFYSEFTTDFHPTYMDISGDEGKNLIVMTQPYSAGSKTTGYIFMAAGMEDINSGIQAELKRSSNLLNLDVYWSESELPPSTSSSHVYQTDFGTIPVFLSFSPRREWSAFSSENKPAILTGLFGFLINILIAMHIYGMTRHTIRMQEEKDTAKNDLHEQSAFYANIIENLPAILFVKNVKDGYRYTMFNKEAEYFFGYKREDMLGKTDFDFFDKDEATSYRMFDEATMKGGKVINIPCETVRTAFGETFTYTRKLPIYDINGEPQYLIGLAQDITKRKKNEMELAEYRENLEKMVDERTRRLKEASLKAEEASRLKSEFLATMSHEIRSPMSGILGMAELLMDTNPSQEQAALTRTILNSGEMLMNIIEDILDFSKIEANKLEIDPISVNMLELVDDVCMVYAPRAREKALEVVVNYHAGTEFFVYADPVRMRQVLGNLVNNAIKFTPKGHIVIDVREDKTVNNPEDKTSLTFSVRDTGIGILDKDKERIFEKFSQANSSTTRKYGGTGLGLSICKSLIEMMGGKIQLDSEFGKGSNFYFTLTFTRNREEVFAPPKPPILKDKRIMIVDDLSVIRFMLSEQLSNAGMICSTCANGSDTLLALQALKETNQLPHIIIIDYLMPGMNGEMLARAINDDPDLRGICLIMLTAAGSPIVSDSFAEKGFSAYITKPVRVLNLIDALAIIWKKYNEGYRDTLIRVDTGSVAQIRMQQDSIHLENARILLVEDSRLNQAFAEEVLSQIGCKVVTVSNGEEAVNTITTDEFSLVLMDCQMPVMDGFEATRKICEMKAQGLVRDTLPIIALTANAMKDDRQRCIDAGMDDYITKPVRKNELKEKVFAWLKGKDTEEFTQKDTMATTSDPSGFPLIDEELLEEARSIMKDKFDFFIDCFIEDVEKYMADIDSAVKNNKMEDMILPAHTIKSTSKRVGAVILSDLAKHIELTAREAANTHGADVASLEETIRKMNEAFNATKGRLLSRRKKTA